LRGERLEADVHIVTGSVTSVRTLIKCCEIAQVQVRDIVLEPLASADAVLRADEREDGVALVDIGGGTTDIAVYREGMLKHTAVLALGGNHITNDISLGLGIPTGEAERIKKLHGYSMTGMIDESRDVDIRREGGKIEKVPLEHIAVIIEPRCEEIMMLVKKEVDIAAREGFRGKELSSRFSGVVLTGGTALLKGIDSVAKLILRLPVRIGVPTGVVNEDLVNSPEYATGVGLLRYGLELQNRDEWSCEPLTTGGIFERMKYWVKGHFQ
jgi:cell division protein FtsA